MPENKTYAPITLRPRDDFKKMPILEYIVMWERGHEGNNFKDSPFTGYIDEDGEIYMYPEVLVGRCEDGKRLPIVAWSPLYNLKAIEKLNQCSEEEMKKLILDTAWKRSLRNPYTGEELQKGDIVSLHNNKTSKTYKDITLNMSMRRGGHGAPIKTFFFSDNGKKVTVTEDFLIFADSVKV